MRLFVAVGDEQAAARVEREAVGLHELALGAGAHLAELPKELAGLVEADQPRRRRRRVAVPFGHQDVAVRVGDDVVRLVERRGVRRLTGLIATGLAERHQQLAVRAELVHLVPDHLGQQRRQRRVSRLSGTTTRDVVLAVGHPDVAIAIHVDAVREDHHALAEAQEQLAGRVELEHRVQRATSRSSPRPSTSSPRTRSATQIVRPSLSMSTALVDPQVRPSGSLNWPSMV